jgi:hypothetical protein
MLADFGKDQGINRYGAISSPDETNQPTILVGPRSVNTSKTTRKRNIGCGRQSFQSHSRLGGQFSKRIFYLMPI